MSMPAAVAVHSSRVGGRAVFRVRWREGGKVLEQTFSDRGDARAFAGAVSARLRGTAS